MYEMKGKYSTKNIWISLVMAIIFGITGNILKSNQKYNHKSEYPMAVDINMVGKYPVDVSSGAGYFYDDVLEYRVWVHPEQGGKDLFEGEDYFLPFITYEEALSYSKKTKGAEEPLVLIRQKEWISEPKPKLYIHMKETRLTEWKVEWLEGRRRMKDSIAKFLKNRVIHGN